MDAIEETILWKRLDAPGYDGCALWSQEVGWRLSGTAVFESEGQACRLEYTLACDEDWRTCSATVAGWVGRSPVHFVIKMQTGQRWMVNGIEQEDIAGLIDVDLGFTPATNLVQFRRLSLGMGQAVDAPVVYLSFPEWDVYRLDHRYHRIAPDAYAYEAPRFDYNATLRVSDAGFVTTYPGLWEIVAQG